MHEADRIVAEANQGGDLIRQVIRTLAHDVAFKSVHASKGKQARAEPVAALWEQGKCHMVGNTDALDDELCNWLPGEGESPNRLDALVWAVTELVITRQIRTGIQVAIPVERTASKWAIR
jgi:phage terminase large subunit-like protein